MNIRIFNPATVVNFPTTYAKDGARTAPAKPERSESAAQAEAKEAVVAQNRLAARTPIDSLEAAARIAALLRGAIPGSANAAIAAQANLDPHRVIALLD
jgi:hypothetical protein